MLEDRDYMRAPANNEPSFPQWLKLPNWSWTMVVIVVNVVCFLLECARSSRPLAHTPDNLFCYQYLALSLEGIKHGCLWQLITYQFMHAGILHLLFNCWAIYMFGRILEELLGARTFLLILLTSGVIGGLFQMVAATLMPAMIDGPVVGASAGAFGLIAAFCTLMPERELFMLLYFIIPIKMRAKTLLIFSLAITCGGIVFPRFFDSLMGGNIANAAHLGGMFAGIMYVRGFVQGRWLGGQGPGSLPEPRSPEAPAPSGPTFWRAKTVRPDAELTADELLKTQVDPILDKISAHGLHSLTQREREILEKASGKLARR